MNNNVNMSVTVKILELKRQFQEYLPELSNKTEFFAEIVKNDFILLNFC